MYRHLAVLLTAFLLFPSAAGAQGLSVALRVGTLGPGLEVTHRLTDRLNIRGGAHFLAYRREDVLTNLEIDVRGDSDVRLFSGGAYADYFPARRGFRLTGGIVFNRNEATVAISPLESYTINEKTFSADRIGTLSVTLGHKSRLNPYAGIGFGNTVRAGTAIGFTIDLGVLYTGSPSLSMAGTGMIAPTAEQAPDIAEDLRGIKLFPVLSLGFAYRIF